MSRSFLLEVDLENIRETDYKKRQIEETICGNKGAYQDAVCAFVSY